MALSSREKKTAAAIVSLLDLQRHPDGGFYLETFRDPSIALPKSALPPRWGAHELLLAHRDPPSGVLVYSTEDNKVFEVHDDGQVKMTVVGPDLRHGQRSQYTVPPNMWFGAFLTCDIMSFTEDGSVFVKTPGRDPELATHDNMKALAPKAEAFINYLVPS